MPSLIDGDRFAGRRNISLSIHDAISFHGETVEELCVCGVDFSFTPVLDLDWGRSSVIGNRALHAEPQAVIQLAASLIEGLAAAGMPSCGKHFPGHGWVEADSHITMPEDERSLEEMAADIQPYRQLKLAAVCCCCVTRRRTLPRYSTSGNHSQQSMPRSRHALPRCYRTLRYCHEHHRVQRLYRSRRL